MTSEMPQNGETRCGLEYRAYYDAWVYMAGYSDMALCWRRAESLSRAFGVPFGVNVLPDGGCYAVLDGGYTDALTPVAPAARTAASEAAYDEVIDSDDLAAHLRETVDELRRGE